MYGVCDKCYGTQELDCYYNDETGEELWLCERCRENINEE